MGRWDAPEEWARCSVGICRALEGAGALGDTLRMAEPPQSFPARSLRHPQLEAASSGGNPGLRRSVCGRLGWSPKATSSPRLRALLPSRSISAQRWLCRPESCSGRPRRGGERGRGGCSVCPCCGGCGAGSGLRHTGEGGDGAEEMLFVLSHPLEEARGGRSEASSRIRVVMVNFHPGTGKPRRFPKISRALCRCWASPGSGMGRVSVGVCQRTAGVPGNSMRPAGTPRKCRPD